jgi:hypothetical protein
MKRLLLLIAVIAVPLFADSSRGRAVAPTPQPGLPVTDPFRPPVMSGATVSGIVSSVNGSLINLANGLVTVDVSGAKVIGANGQTTTITAGSTIFAVLKAPDAATANTPLAAAIVTVTRTHDVAINGTIQSVDVAASTITILGRTIKITSDTTIYGFFESSGALHVGDLKSGEIAMVNADAKNGALVAFDVHVNSLIPRPSLSFFMGTVKSIANDVWIVTVDGKDVRFVINGQTNINGQPKVGDIVNVVASTDSSGAYIAVSITTFVSLPTAHVRVVGTLKSIDDHAAVVSNGLIDTRFTITSTTKIIGAPKAGDRVEAIGEELPLLIYPPIINATSITKL